MAKSSLTSQEREIWFNLLKFTTWQQENIVRDLDRLFGLRPRVIRLGSSMVPYTFARFELEVNRNDHHCTAYYSPKDVSQALGSREKNYRDWTRTLLGCGRTPHPHLQKIPWSQIGVQENKPPDWPNRFLSIQALVFYLAAQTRTWGENPSQLSRITKVKELLVKHRIQGVLPVPAYQEDLSELDELAPAKPKQPTTGVALMPLPVPRAIGPHYRLGDLFNTLRDLEEEDYLELMRQIEGTRRHNDYRRDLRLAVRSAIGGDSIPLGTLIQKNGGLQDWMVRAIAIDTTKKYTHEISVSEMLRTRMSLLLLANTFDEKRFYETALALAGLCVQSQNFKPLYSSQNDV